MLANSSNPLRSVTPFDAAHPSSVDTAARPARHGPARPGPARASGRWPTVGPVPDPELHPSLSPIAFLLGEWEGRGEGHYPTIDAFTFTERLTFAHVGKPFVSYLQRTHGAGGAPMHTEAGYLRVTGSAPGAEGHTVEMVVAQPTGVTEVLAGTVVDDDVRLHSHDIGLTPTAKVVTGVERRFRLHGSRLAVDTSMAAVGEPLTHHLSSELAPAHRR